MAGLEEDGRGGKPVCGSAGTGLSGGQRAWKVKEEKLDIAGDMKFAKMVTVSDTVSRPAWRGDSRGSERVST